jgi:hypothetical protein
MFQSHCKHRETGGGEGWRGVFRLALIGFGLQVEGAGL